MPGLAAMTAATSLAASFWNSCLTSEATGIPSRVTSPSGRNGAVAASPTPRRPAPIVPPTSAPIAACSNISPASTSFPVTIRGLAYSMADWMASVPPSSSAALPIRPSAVLAGAARIPPKPNWSNAVTASAPGATLTRSENSTSCRPSSSVASLAWLPKMFDIPKPGSGAAAAIMPGTDCATPSIANGIALRRKSFFTSSHLVASAISTPLSAAKRRASSVNCFLSTGSASIARCVSFIFAVVDRSPLEKKSPRRSKKPVWVLISSNAPRCPSSCIYAVRSRACFIAAWRSVK